jgi:hypothetical protein
MDIIVQDSILKTFTEKSLQPNSRYDEHHRNPATLVYLQHLDCDLCQHTIKELRQIASTDPSFSSMIFFHPGSVSDGDSLKKMWPDAAVIADETGHLYRQLPWSEAAFGQCLALTNRLDTTQNYTTVLLNFWRLPQAIETRERGDETKNTRTT